jgi:hypothetical protein
MLFLAAKTLPQQSHLLESLTTAQLYFPIALLVIGTLLMIFGFKAYKWIVFLNFVGLGYYLGDLMGRHSNLGVFGGTIGAVLMGVASLPLMKWAAAVCGGMVGAVIGMVVWAYCEQPLDMAWAGALVGVAVLGMLTFIWFKTTVILFTSIQGAAMFVLATFSLLLRYAPWHKDVITDLDTKPVLLPLLVISMTAVAMYWQHHRHGLIGNDGAPATPKGGGGGDKKKP